MSNPPIIFVVLFIVVYIKGIIAEGPALCKGVGLGQIVFSLLSKFCGEI